MKHELQRLNKEHLIQEAERRSEISATRNRTIEEPLEILIDSINTEARLSSLGQKLAIASFTRILTNQLLLDRELENFPKPEKDKKYLFILVKSIPESAIKMKTQHDITTKTLQTK